MSKKGTGLAAFAVKPVAVATSAKPAAVAGARQRGKGDMVSLTVRVTRDQWQRLHELALHDGQSLNTLALDGFSRLFQERGLKPL